MICPETGEVVFEEFRVAPDERFAECDRVPSPRLGFSEWGTFYVGVACDSEGRAQIVFLSYADAAYNLGVPEIPDRRAYHKAIIEVDLLGLSEFSWGKVRHFVALKAGRDWLVLTFHFGPGVPRRERIDPWMLRAAVREPRGATAEDGGG